MQAADDDTGVSSDGAESDGELAQGEDDGWGPGASDEGALAGWEGDSDEDALEAELLAAEDFFGSPAPEPSRGDRLADLASGLAGLRYSWGGTSPTTGFDCSGLVYYVHRQFGVTLNRDAASQFANGRSVARADLQPGDIVFFADTYRSGISHDGIYLGGGRFVHAVNPGSGVRITSMGDGYWGPKYVGARRIFD
jgi:hypothetical protein